MAADVRFATLVERNRHPDPIDAAIAQWTATCDLAQIETALGELNIPATRIFSMADIFAIRTSPRAT